MRSLSLTLCIIGLLTGVLGDTLSVFPHALTFRYTLGGSVVPTSQRVSISVVPNDGEVHKWQTRVTANWLKVNPLSGQFTNAPGQTIISIDPSGISEPVTLVQRQQFTFSDHTGAAYVTVTLVVTAPPPCENRTTCAECLAAPSGCGFCLDSGLCSNATATTCQNYFTSSCPQLCPNNCSSHGQCNYNNGDCTCDTNYYSSDCSDFCTSAGNCSGNGQCTNNGCDCSDYYYGDDCSVFCNASQTCNGRGQCNADGGCQCVYPYDGLSCEFMQCPGIGNGCTNHGSCNNLTGICTCNENYFDSECSVFCSSNSTCSNHGECNQTSGACECDEPYFGFGCNVFCENNTTCSNNGYCNVGGTCNCNSGYYTSSCNVFCGSNTTCSNNGYCNGAGTCSCYSGYYNSSCNVFCNSATTCNANGVCSTNGTCTCTAPYFGDTCLLAQCRGYDTNNTCNSHGVCNTTTGMCTCNEEGFNCDAQGSVIMSNTPSTNCYECPKPSWWTKQHTIIVAGSAGAAGLLVVAIIGFICMKQKRHEGYVSM